MALIRWELQCTKLTSPLVVGIKCTVTVIHISQRQAQANVPVGAADRCGRIEERYSILIELGLRARDRGCCRRNPSAPPLWGYAASGVPLEPSSSPLCLHLLFSRLPIPPLPPRLASSSTLP